MIKHKCITWNHMKHNFVPDILQLSLHVQMFISLLLEGTRRLDMTTSIESAWTLRT